MAKVSTSLFFSFAKLEATAEKNETDCYVYERFTFFNDYIFFFGVLCPGKKYSVVSVLHGNKYILEENHPHHPSNKIVS